MIEFEKHLSYNHGTTKKASTFPVLYTPPRVLVESARTARTHSDSVRTLHRLCGLLMILGVHTKIILSIVAAPPRQSPTPPLAHHLRTNTRSGSIAHVVFIFPPLSPMQLHNHIVLDH